MTKSVLCHGCLFGFTGDILCEHCLSAYSLRYEPGGPRAGGTAELIQISTVERQLGIDGNPRDALVNDRQPTGHSIQILGDGTFIEIDGVSIEGRRYELGGVNCPRCGSPSLKFYFNQGDVCPRCGAAKIHSGGIIV